MKTALFAALLFAVPAVAQTYTVTPFGAQCGGTLQAQVVTAPTGAGLRLGVSSSHNNAHVFLVVGHPQATPVQLPGSQCLLLVDPRVTMHDVTTATGSARFAFRIPPMLPIRIDFQAVIVGQRPNGRVAESTNGVRLVGV